MDTPARKPPVTNFNTHMLLPWSLTALVDWSGHGKVEFLWCEPWRYRREDADALRLETIRIVPEGLPQDDFAAVMFMRNFGLTFMVGMFDIISPLSLTNVQRDQDLRPGGGVAHSPMIDMTSAPVQILASDSVYCSLIFTSEGTPPRTIVMFTGKQLCQAR